MKKALLILLLIKFNGIIAQSVLNKYLDNYQYEKVLIVCDSIYQKSDSVSQLLKIQASALYALNRYKEAVDIYQSLAKKDSLDTSTLIRIANCYKNLNDYNKSILYFQKATTIQPENSYIRSQIGECYFKMSNYSQAKDYYFELYEIDSSYFNSKMLAQCYDQLNQIDSAIQFYNIALTSYPSDFTISYRLAVLYKDKEEFNNAEQIIKTYQIHDSLNVKMIKLHGFIKYLDYNFDSASLEFEKCKLLGDTSLFIYKHLGNCYFVLDNYEKAILNLKEAYNRDQNDFDVIYAIGLSALKTDSIDLAKKFLKRSLNLVTPSDDFLSELYQANAEAYTKNFEYQKALNYYLLAHEKTPDNKYLNYKIANHYDMLIHDQENAIQYYENYLALEDRTDSLPFSHDTLKKNTKNAEYVKNRLNKLNEEKFWEGKMK